MSCHHDDDMSLQYDCDMIEKSVKPVWCEFDALKALEGWNNKLWSEIEMRN